MIFSLRFLQDYWELDKDIDIQEYLLLEICSKIMFLGSKIIYRYPIHYPELRNIFGVDLVWNFVKKATPTKFLSSGWWIGYLCIIYESKNMLFEQISSSSYS